jgi:hypothetical protein
MVLQVLCKRKKDDRPIIIIIIIIIMMHTQWKQLKTLPSLELITAES